MAEHSETSPRTPHSLPTRPRPDDTPPRNRVIASYTIMAVITLVALKYVFESYMDLNRQHVRTEHVNESYASRQLEDYRSEQRRRMSQGALPLERAMSDLGRAGRGSFPQIAPQPSTDLDPLRGWAQLPRMTTAQPADTAATPAEETAPSAEVAPDDDVTAPAHEQQPRPNQPATEHTEARLPADPEAGAQPTTRPMRPAPEDVPAPTTRRVGTSTPAEGTAAP